MNTLLIIVGIYLLGCILCYRFMTWIDKSTGSGKITKETRFINMYISGLSFITLLITMSVVFYISIRGEMNWIDNNK